MTGELIKATDVLRDVAPPTEVKDALLLFLEQDVVEQRAQRGEVSGPEGYYALIRRLQSSRELLDEYRHAFTVAAKFCADQLAEEHEGAVGEQDGVPLAGLKVPDADGTDVVFKLDNLNGYTFDLDALVTIAVRSVVERVDTINALVVSGDALLYSRENDDLEQENAAWMAHAAEISKVVAEAVGAVLDLGTFAPQVSKVRAFATKLARDAQDEEAALVKATISKTVRHKGVTIKREAQK